jgi:hypothetical protein
MLCLKCSLPKTQAENKQKKVSPERKKVSPEKKKESPNKKQISTK